MHVGRAVRHVRHRVPESGILPVNYGDKSSPTPERVTGVVVVVDEGRLTDFCRLDQLLPSFPEPDAQGMKPEPIGWFGL